ncbi:MAG TPA: VOC family protein, partial [Acidimicrobiia bacterium]|nr:VOC family protein [Acidimicrobiia bacterium]
MQHDASAVAEGLGDLVERFDHVSVAVADLRRPGPLPGLLGGRFFNGGAERPSGFAWAQWRLPSAKLEIVAPLGDDSFLHDFLRRRGEGLHHVTLKVTDIDAAIHAARAMGLDVIQIDASR